VKKKLKVIALLLICCMSFIFTGCDLFVRNDAEYYNQPVISIKYDAGKKIEISRKDYLSTYNNYGLNLIQSYGYSEKQAKDATVDVLTNRKILLEEAKRLSGTEEGSSIALTTEDKKELYYQTYSSLIASAKDYDEQINKDWNTPKVDTMEEGTSSEETIVYNSYTKKAKPVYDSVSKEFKIKLLNEDENVQRDVVFNSLAEIYNAFIAETKNNVTDRLAREEYRRLLATLQANQKVFGTKYNEKELIEEEIKRIYNNLEENEYISKYEEYTKENRGFSYITVNQVLEKYKSMVYSSKFVYEQDSEKYNTDMLESLKDVNYFVDDNYFYVAHILIKFNDEQQATYDSLETLSNNGQGYIISVTEYEEQKANLYNNLKADVRDSETGEIVSTDSVSAKDVLKEIEVALANANTKEAKDEAFRQLMYKYNEDPGIMNADYPYIIGNNDSKMVESFTEASRELDEKGEYGAISGLVESEYGVHIIYYMGDCKNAFDANSDGLLEIRENYTIENEFGEEVNYSDVLKLDEMYLNNLNNKTIFDLIYEGLEKDNYSEFENRNLNSLKETYGIKITVLKKI